MLKCNLCNYEMPNSRSLATHIQTVHNLSTRDYTIQTICNGVEPKCVRCGAEVRYVSFGFKKYCKEHGNLACSEGGRIGGSASKKIKEEIVTLEQPETKKEKMCSSCRVVKSIDDFHVSKTGSLGVYSKCKICVNEQIKIYRIENAEKIAEKKKERYQRNKQPTIERAKRYYHEHREQALANSRIRHEQYPEIRKAYKHSPKGCWSDYRSNAKKRDHVWNLSFEEFSSFWQKSCVYCGSFIDTIGLDRVDSSKGYSLDNVVPCCYTCNCMKLDHSKDEFIAHLRVILQHCGKDEICDCEFKELGDSWQI